MLQDIQILLNNYQKVIIMVAIAVIVDTMTGISKAIMNSEFSVQSKLLRKTFTKILQYSAILILFAGIELTFNFPAFTISCVSIIVIELKSISENVSAIPQLKNIVDSIITKIDSSEED